MTRATNARIAGFTFLAYIAAGITSMVLFGRAAAGEGVAAKLAGIAAHAGAAVALLDPRPVPAAEREVPLPGRVPEGGRGLARQLAERGELRGVRRGGGLAQLRGAFRRQDQVVPAGDRVDEDGPGANFDRLYAEVPDDNRIGDVNNGWAAANTTLFHERSGMAARGGGGEQHRFDAGGHAQRRRAADLPVE